MKYCAKCGTELSEETIVCPTCGYAEYESAQPVTEDKVSVGLCVLAALIPLFGFIYWPVKHKAAPKKAKACGIAAIISWAVGFVFSMLYSVVIVGLLGAML